MPVEERRDADLVALCDLARRVDAADGYPGILQAGVRSSDTPVACRLVSVATARARYASGDPAPRQRQGSPGASRRSGRFPAPLRAA